LWVFDRWIEFSVKQKALGFKSIRIRIQDLANISEKVPVEIMMGTHLVMKNGPGIL
jgi:hypothetical protein